jgi:1,4-dihydroxy-2-naphthoate octaprenyltransferase
MVQILVNDLRDIDGDRTSGTLSLPVVLGEPAARRVGLVLALIGALLPLSMLPLPFLLAGLYSAFIVLRYRRERDSEWRGWIEGQGLVAGLAALIYAARS